MSLFASLLAFWGGFCSADSTVKVASAGERIVAMSFLPSCVNIALLFSIEISALVVIVQAS